MCQRAVTPARYGGDASVVVAYAFILCGPVRLTLLSRDRNFFSRRPSHNGFRSGAFPQP
jgi:hypothetical protein